jgi:hypothetical protein
MLGIATTFCPYGCRHRRRRCVIESARPTRDPAAARTQVLSQPDIFASRAAGLTREEAALVEYYMARNASRFVGNSVSTFSALTLLERRHHRLWASYYNGGNIPLATHVPLYDLPWVFTYNSWSNKCNALPPPPFPRKEPYLEGC